MLVKIADICFEINNRYDYIKDLCTDYICSSGKPEFSLSIGNNDLFYEKTVAEHRCNNAYYESTAVLRKLSAKLALKRGCVFHGAVVLINNRAVAFTAPSGVGKTTHILNLKKLLGNRLLVINGDKPILKVKNNRVYAYGTPWAGKENLQTNVSAPLSAVCFVNRADKNSIKNINYKVGAQRLLRQMYFFENALTLDACLDIINTGEKTIKFFDLFCTADFESAQTTYKALEGKLI